MKMKSTVVGHVTSMNSENIIRDKGENHGFCIIRL
jgi:hypothetical protein